MIIQRDGEASDTAVSVALHRVRPAAPLSSVDSHHQGHSAGLIPKR